MIDRNVLGDTTFHWFVGTVEGRQDPLALGRVQVRVFGSHTASLTDIPTEDLPWAVVVQPATASAPLSIKESDIVVGFWADAQDKQIPIIMGVMPGFITVPNQKGVGFNDLRTANTLANSPVPVTSRTYNADGSGIKVESPSQAQPYPLPSQLEFPTFSGATRYDTANNVIGARQKNLDKGVVTATGLTWDEPYPAFNALYPFNKAYESESGHIMEIDDTPGAERIATNHRTGSYEEWRPTGSKVQKVTKSNYEIVMGDDYLHVMGRCLITIGEGAYIKVAGDVNLEFDGDANIGVAGDANFSVGGGFNVKAKSFNVDAEEDATVVAGGDAFITPSGDANIKTGGDVNLQGNIINLDGEVQQSTLMINTILAGFIDTGAGSPQPASAGEGAGLQGAPPKGSPNTGVAGPEPTPIPFPQNFLALDAYSAQALKHSMFNGANNTPADANAANTTCTFDANTRTFLSSSDWSLDSAGQSAIQQREGLAKILTNGMVQAYPDPVLGPALLTIGYGTTNAVLPVADQITANTVITKDQAAQFMNDAVDNIFLPKLQEYVTVDLTQAMVDALISLMYNIGVPNFASSSVLKFVNQQNWCAAANAFLLWNKSGGQVVAGLTTRRQAEKGQFLT